ncbi:MAG: cytochrome P460 family protein [Gemmatimonadota bacterium]
MKVNAVLLTIIVIGLTACGGDQPAEDAADETVPAVTATPSLPDTTEAALWAYLQQSDYQQNWRLWPGKEHLYKGTEPHGMLLTTYVNELAHDALTNGAASLPAGAIVVKENYMPDSILAAVTTMYKSQGFNAQHQDWFFAKHDPQGKAEVAGRAEMCQACHQKAPAGNYLYTARPQ